MLKTTLKLTALSAVSLTLLTACGAASKLEDAADRAQDELDNAADRAENELERITGGNGNNQTPRDPFLADPIAAVADRISSESRKGTYSHNRTPANFSDDTFNLMNIESQDTFTIRAGTTANTLIMTVNGVDYTLTRGSGGEHHGSGSVFISNNNSADTSQIIAGTHPTIQGDYINYSTNTDDFDTGGPDFNWDYTSGYTTVGIQTAASVIASQTATATYNGSMLIETNPINQINTNPNIDFTSSGSLAMTVDFDADTVSGTGTITLGGSGTVTFDSAPIVGNGFAGTFTLDSATRTAHSITDNPTGNYAGNFFGPAADDIAGVMRFSGTSSQGNFLGRGGFRADRDTQ